MVAKVVEGQRYAVIRLPGRGGELFLPPAVVDKKNTLAHISFTRARVQALPSYTISIESFS